MFENLEFVRELNESFELYRHPETGNYDVYPKHVGWNCVLKGAVGETDGMWVYKGGEDTYMFVQHSDTLEIYHGDFWEMMLNEVERREAFASAELD